MPKCQYSRFNRKSCYFDYSNYVYWFLHLIHNFLKIYVYFLILR